MKKFSARKIFAVIVIVVSILLHLVGIGKYLTGLARQLFSSYFSDLILPFCFYYILVIAKNFKILKTCEWYFGFVLLICCIAEIGQYFGLPLLGNTFDVIDFAMYFTGVGSAYLLDKIVLCKTDR